ncbi:MAG: hypothetical protein IRY85_23455, partial [Micromonosporaceae bacterium]|nr:hypothetical protein [Micromonosporaceae bacterium]
MIPEPVGKPTDSPSDEAQREDARVAYSSAIALWAYEGESAWSRFNAMLVANSILLAFIGFLYGSDNPPKLPILAVAVFGILFCAVWWVITVRAFDHQSYWVLSARELEERYL